MTIAGDSRSIAIEFVPSRCCGLGALLLHVAEQPRIVFGHRRRVLAVEVKCEDTALGGPAEQGTHAVQEVKRSRLEREVMPGHVGVPLCT
jgi:hypothetical protein